jgi:hypothetical protein
MQFDGSERRLSVRPMRRADSTTSRTRTASHGRAGEHAAASLLHGPWPSRTGNGAKLTGLQALDKQPFRVGGPAISACALSSPSTGAAVARPSACGAVEAITVALARSDAAGRSVGGDEPSEGPNFQRLMR